MARRKDPLFGQDQIWPKLGLLIYIYTLIWTIIGANLGLIWGMSTLFLKGPTWNDDELDDFPKVDGLMALQKRQCSPGDSRCSSFLVVNIQF